ncbi:hypothetical protein FZ025_04565 [Xanthomonas hyacinthi]|uniref:hypothetical protein n=1 Tax=Xanthomonas hyacinthi TaxID=56455 RepID=UPI000CEE1454|nr:hypothetical protein FZ025_04565 [Xanthomonas hyacinthi]
MGVRGAAAAAARAGRRALPRKRARRPLRDAGYRLIARNRYRWFGSSAPCFLPDPAQRSRFLE